MTAAPFTATGHGDTETQRKENLRVSVSLWPVIGA